MNRLMKFVLTDIIRNKIVLAFTIFLSLLSWSVFAIEDSSNKGFLTLLNVVLLVSPLFSILFSTIYLYNSSEFIELMVSQPVKRVQIWISLYMGLGISLISSFLLAAGIPLLIFVEIKQALLLCVSGSLITLTFLSIAFCTAIYSRDKAKGIGITLLIWLFFALLFDGLVMFVMFQFLDYPIEKLMVLVSASNPIDLVRILNLIQLDASAMMGYTGAIFKNYFGTFGGMLVSFSILLGWVFIPLWISLRIFNRKDL